MYFFFFLDGVVVCYVCVRLYCKYNYVYMGVSEINVFILLFLFKFEVVVDLGGEFVCGMEEFVIIGSYWYKFVFI